MQPCSPQVQSFPYMPGPSRYSIFDLRHTLIQQYKRDWTLYTSANRHGHRLLRRASTKVTTTPNWWARLGFNAYNEQNGRLTITKGICGGLGSLRADCKSNGSLKEQRTVGSISDIIATAEEIWVQLHLFLGLVCRASIYLCLVLISQ